MWKNTAEPKRPQMTIWRTRIACWVYTVTDTLKHATIIAFLLQQWLNERASMLRYAYIGVLYLMTELNTKIFWRRWLMNKM
jgi:hypothetical protein